MRSISTAASRWPITYSPSRSPPTARTDAARRALANAANALADAAPDDPVAESDGRTAADLRKAVWAGLEAIDAA